MDPKQRAAQAALDFVESGMKVGLGTGSTADWFLIALAGRLADGSLRDIRGVPTSSRSRIRAEELGIPLIELTEADELDVTIDGADEVTDSLDLIKGLGGALLREKIVAQHSRKLVIIADASKRVHKLGTHAPLPVEVVQFSHAIHIPFLRQFGCEPVLRRAADGTPLVTDNGNHIYDCRFPNGIERPDELDHAMRGRAGIVETGLFVGIASAALVADEKHVIQLKGAVGS